MSKPKLKIIGIAPIAAKYITWALLIFNKHPRGKWNLHMGDCLILFEKGVISNIVFITTQNKATIDVIERPISSVDRVEVALLYDATKYYFGSYLPTVYANLPTTEGYYGTKGLTLPSIDNDYTATLYTELSDVLKLADTEERSPYNFSGTFDVAVTLVDWQSSYGHFLFWDWLGERYYSDGACVSYLYLDVPIDDNYKLTLPSGHGFVHGAAYILDMDKNPTHLIVATDTKLLAYNIQSRTWSILTGPTLVGMPVRFTFTGEKAVYKTIPRVAVGTENDMVIRRRYYYVINIDINNLSYTISEYDTYVYTEDGLIQHLCEVDAAEDIIVILGTREWWNDYYSFRVVVTKDGTELFESYRIDQPSGGGDTTRTTTLPIRFDYRLDNPILCYYKKIEFTSASDDAAQDYTNVFFRYLTDEYTFDTYNPGNPRYEIYATRPPYLFNMPELFNDLSIQMGLCFYRDSGGILRTLVVVSYGELPNIIKTLSTESSVVNNTQTSDTLYQYSYYQYGRLNLVSTI